jgi:type III pantothenate kinase
MKKILLVDIGNTRIKWTLSAKQGMEETGLETRKPFSWQKENLPGQLSSHWGDLERPEAVYVSNVAGEDVNVILSNWCQFQWNITPDFAVVTKTCCGVTNSYPEPQKLGVDRWLAMIAGWDLVGNNVCVIDCGSAVTIDVINSSGEHLGGMIAPGLALSGRALTDHTHALTAEQRNNFSMLADNTEDAISSGCYHLFIGGVQHVIGKIRQQFGADMTYIITGGDAELVLENSNDTGTEIRHEPELILQGLLLSSNEK